MRLLLEAVWVCPTLSGSKCQPLLRPGSQLFQLAFGTVLNCLALSVSSPAVGRQQVQCFLGMFSRRLFLTIGKVRVRQAIIRVR